jgi:hypothetical protein
LGGRAKHWRRGEEQRKGV